MEHRADAREWGESRGSRIVWEITKWVLIPGLVAMVGYFFVGPRIPTGVLPKNIVQSVPVLASEPPKAGTDNTPEPTSSAVDPDKANLAPQLEIDVQPATGRRR
ncbi:MAG: hypothetical protein Fur0036_05000 [Fimbriimonadaceae bacterium]